MRSFSLLVLIAVGGCGGSRVDQGDAGLAVDAGPAADAVNDLGLDAGWRPPDYGGQLVPGRPAEAFDRSRIQHASLAELRWELVGSATPDGVMVLDGNWSPGTYTGPLASGEGTKTITLASRGRLYYPVDAMAPLPVVVFAAHLATLVPQSETNHARIAQGLGVAVLVHGEHEADAAALGYPTDDASWRGRMVEDGLADLFVRNACGLTDLLTSNYGYVLARTNMLALTLAQRLLEANGLAAGPAALRGGSKEGYATWIAASVDDRLVLGNPGGFQRQDLDGLSAYARNSGCGPNGASPVVTIPAALAARDWLADTPEGQAAARVLLVSELVGELHPELLLLDGDVGMPGMHDGIHFTLGAETHFLDGFTARPYRYDRWPGPGALPPGAADRRLALLAHLLGRADRAAEVGRWVRVTAATAADQGDAGITFQATVVPAPTHVRVHWNESPDRELNDADQTAWRTAELVRVTGDEFATAAPITPTAGYQVAWYIAAEQSLPLSGQITVTRQDASPIRLLRELPALDCASYPPVQCGN